MKPIYRQVLADFDRRIARLQGIRREIAAVADLDDNAAEDRQAGRAATRGPGRPRGPWTKGRAKTGGGDQVVLDAIASGADTFPKVLAEAKVSPYVARQAMKRLKAAGKMHVDGATVSARYRIGPKKK